MNNTFFPILGSTGLLLVCVVLFFGLFLVFLIIWLFVACLVDAFLKSEQEFPDRTLWIILLIGSAFVSLMWLSSIVYYFMYRPKLDFWRY